MEIHRHVEKIRRRIETPVLTLGNFDGVHEGHRAIFSRVVDTAREIRGTPTALTFHPHPAAVLTPQRAPARLTDWRARMERMAAAGIGVAIVQRFTRRFSEIDPVDFVERLLVDGLGVGAIVVGHRVSFGHRRRGNAAVLQELGSRHGFSVEVVGPVEVDGFEVSSSAIRKAIAEGDLARAAHLLGGDPIVAGRVGHGDRRGASLGFPTANIPVAGWAVPPDGVYAVAAFVGGEVHPAVANLGRKPTFGEAARGLEVHLLDFEGDLYGARLEARLLARLRGEQKFAGPKELVAQIARDVEAARVLFSSTE